MLLRIAQTIGAVALVLFVGWLGMEFYHNATDMGYNDRSFADVCYGGEPGYARTVIEKDSGHMVTVNHDLRTGTLEIWDWGTVRKLSRDEVGSLCNDNPFIKP